MKTFLKGWILDIYEDETDGVRIWFITEENQRICLKQYLPVRFFAAGPRERLHQYCLAIQGTPGLLHLSRENKRDVFKPEPVCVLEIEMDNPVRQRLCFQRLKKDFPDLIYYNADLAVHIHHAARYHTFPLAFCSVTYDSENQEILNLEVLNSRWDVAPLHPVLRILEMEPSCDPNKKNPESLRLSYNHHTQQIRMSDPANVLNHINQLIEKIDPDLIQTKWGDDWLFPELLEMESTAGIPLKMNRDEERKLFWKKEITYYSYGQIVFRGREAHLFGRCHIDTKNAVMWSDYHLDGALESARVTTLPIEQAARVSPGSGISAMQMITALEQDVLVPEQKQQIEASKSALDLIQFDRGGLIYQPRTGLHCNVAEIDFTSMYPAVIINGNISPEVPLPDGLKPASSVLGIVPLTLKPLYEKRVLIKEKLLHFPDKSAPLAKSYTARASALKWLLVVCFGFLGYKNARFGRIEAHEAVTRGGREALLIAKETSEEMDCEVLHMFVDALWIQKSGCKKVSDFQPVLDEISRRTGMIISMDGIYRWIAFLPSRANDDQPVPNRYFGVFEDGSLKIRGIEARRRDVPAWIIETQLEMLNCLAKAADARKLPDYLPKAFRIFHNALEDINADRIPPEKLIVTNRISRKLCEYKAPTAAVRAARQLLEATGKNTAPGQKIRYLYTVGTPDVFAWEIPEPIQREQIDKSKYRELLARAAGTILYPFGINAKQISDYTHGGLQLNFFD